MTQRRIFLASPAKGRWRLSLSLGRTASSLASFEPQFRSRGPVACGWEAERISAWGFLSATTKVFSVQRNTLNHRIRSRSPPCSTCSTGSSPSLSNSSPSASSSVSGIKTNKYLKVSGLLSSSSQSSASTALAYVKTSRWSLAPMSSRSSPSSPS